MTRGTTIKKSIRRLTGAVCALAASACLAAGAGCGTIIIEQGTEAVRETITPKAGSPNNGQAQRREPAPSPFPKEAPQRKETPVVKETPPKDTAPKETTPKDTAAKDTVAAKEGGTERRLFELVNDARRKGRRCGPLQYGPAPPLLWNDRLAQASLEHALDMAKGDFLSHQGSDGSDLADRISKLGYRLSTVGENIGQGQKTPEEMLDLWLESEQHCQNIMNPDFKEAGAASAKNPRKTYWALVFGAPRR